MGDTLPAGGTPQTILRKLRFLEYPQLQQWEAAQSAESLAALLRSVALKDIIMFLEESKIRFWTQKERKGLHDFSNPSLWWRVVARYYSALGLGTIAGELPTERLRVVNVLLTIAIEDEYVDRKEANGIANKSQAIVADEEMKSDDEVVALLNEALKAYALPQLTSSDEESILAAIQVIAMRLQNDRPMAIDKEPSVVPPAKDLPVGVPLKSNVLRAAAGVLRTLHQRQLSKAQLAINKTLTELQQVTGDPKTDSRLGKVGF